MSSAINILQNFFLNPIWLGLLAGIIPLTIFYLVRKKPEKQIMPSIMFFMQQQKDGKAHQALRKLMRNWLLILHILIISAIAAAAASPYISSQSSPEKNVVVLDRSASMNQEFSEAKKFAIDNLGSENTVIVVDETAQVVEEDVSRRRAGAVINDIKAVETETDLFEGLRLAQKYEGRVVIVSDLSDTASSSNIDDIIQDMRDSGRSFTKFKATTSNKWGITEVEKNEHNITVKISSFVSDKQNLTVNINGNPRYMSLPNKETISTSFKPETGKNTVRLPEDDFKTDNTAYIAAPETGSYSIGFISENGNEYFETALDLIEFTEPERLDPPVNNDFEHDIYVLDGTNNILASNVEKIDEEVKNGKTLVLFVDQGTRNLDIEALKPSGNNRVINASVTLNNPVNVNIGSTKIVNTSFGGETHSVPEEAVQKIDHGEGDILIYNIRDEDFRFNFVYPIFWKKSLQDLQERPSIHELNHNTGDEFNGKELEKTGFFNNSGQIHATNLESYAESQDENKKLSESEWSPDMEKKDVQLGALALLLLLIIFETAYLYRIGDLKK